MGYETKAIIGNKTNSKFGMDAYYFSIISTVDLRSCGHSGALPNLITKATRGDNSYEDVFAYITNSDKADTEDRYGDKLRAVPIKEVYNALIESMENDNSHKEGYRKYNLLKSVLEAHMTEQFSDLYVILYGY